MIDRADLRCDAQAGRWNGANVRVVGYVREGPDPKEGIPAFAQSERIRRWATDGGHQLVAVCQDLRAAENPSRRDGLRAVMGILTGGSAEAVVVPDLSILSPDKVVQEIIIRDLRAHGATVISAEEGDHSQLEDPTSDRLRMVVRDVLTRLDEHEARFADEPPLAAEGESAVTGRNDVIVELISAEPPEPLKRIRPVR